MHMHCIAHILNLIVNEGLKDANISIKSVREAIRYVRNSPSRLRKFREYSELDGVECKSSLSLDVPTRWNSTYLMLKIASTYEKAFQFYEEHESNFRLDLGDNVPTYKDLEYVKQYVKFLHHFYELTLRISSSQYITANLFFNEIFDLLCTLNEW